jgi:hypothetical protein
MKNRLGILDLYTVPDGCPGRKEAVEVVKEEGIVVKQNLILTLVDITQSTDYRSRRFSSPIYGFVFYDLRNIKDRISNMAQELDGTHSRRTNDCYDDASFSIYSADKIVEYLTNVDRQGIQVFNDTSKLRDLMEVPVSIPSKN